MRRNNNPINIALSEARHLWPTSPNPDVFISLGTGSVASELAPRISKFRNFLVDGWMPRIYRSFSSSFDGQNAWREVIGVMDKISRESSFRFDLSVPGGLPRLDDTECMDRLSVLVHSRPSGLESHKDAVAALLATSFYFQLDTVPEYHIGLFQCVGSIRCRAPPQHVIHCLDTLDSSQKDLYKDKINLGIQLTSDDICHYCLRYSRPIRFFVRDLTENIVLSLRFGSKLHRLSAFPNNMQWFAEQQGLNWSFGHSNHCSFVKQECVVCEARGVAGVRKRKYTDI
jgi:hypothetical protein